MRERRARRERDEKLHVTPLTYQQGWAFLEVNIKILVVLNFFVSSANKRVLKSISSSQGKL